MLSIIFLIAMLIVSGIYLKSIGNRAPHSKVEIKPYTSKSELLLRVLGILLSIALISFATVDFSRNNGSNTLSSAISAVLLLAFFSYLIYSRLKK